MKATPAQVRDIFLAAVEAEDVSQFLDDACGQDAQLRARVDELLASHQQAGDFLKPPSVAGSLPHAIGNGEGVGATIGRYKLLELVGEGGFGDVYMAEQQEPVRRKVALKIIKLGMDTRQVIARFEAERQALALMDHPNIAKVLDAGATDAGRPYFVMGLVKGLPITDYCEANSLTVEDRLRLMIDVCHAVQHAHQKGIIHRDLKPTNILVAQDNLQPIPKIIDFGVAKATQQRLTEKTLFTEHRQLVGTPEYMSPEQATFGESDVDTRSDIYSLGVLLYELIVGATPFDAEELGGSGYDEICRVIREVDPATPSRRLGALGEEAANVCERRSIEPAAFRKVVHGDLDWIVMKCLEKDRARRYASAADIAQELERFLAGQPIQARPISKLARASRWCRRNPTLAGLSAAVAGLLLLLSTGGPIAAVRQSSLATREAKAREQAQELRDESMLLAAELAFDRAFSLCDEGQIGQGMLWFARTLEIAPTSAVDLRRVTLMNLAAWKRALHTLELVLPHEAAVFAVSFSPDGKTVLTGGDSDIVRLWDAYTGEPIRQFVGHGEINSVAFSADGSQILTGGGDAVARLWDAAAGNLVHELVGHQRWVTSVAISPDGQTLLTGSSDYTARLWEARTGELIHELVGHTGTIRAVHSVAFSPDGQLALTASMDQTARLWDVATGKLVRLFPHSSNPEASVAFSPDGAAILTGSDGEGKVLTLWEVSTGDPIGVTFGGGSAHSVAFNNDGTRLLTSTGQLWNVTGQPIGSPLRRFNVHDVAISPIDDRFLLGCDDFIARIFLPVSPRRPVITIQPPTKMNHDGVALSPDGRILATVTWWSDLVDQTVRLWSADSGELVHELKGHRAGLTGVTFSPDGQMVLSSSNDGTARLWNVNTGEFIRQFAADKRGVWGVAFGPYGKTVLTGGLSGNAQLWRCDTGERIGLPIAHKSRVLASRFSPDGKTFVTASRGAQLWDSSTRVPCGPPLNHEGQVPGVSFSPDGSLLLTGSFEGTSCLWETSTGRMIGAPMESHGTGVTFSPDGRWMLTGSQLREVATRKPIGPSLGKYATSAIFTPDGSRVVIGEEDVVSIWDFAVDVVEDNVDRIKLWVEVSTGQALSAEGNVRVLDAAGWRMRQNQLAALGGPPGGF